MWEKHNGNIFETFRLSFLVFGGHVFYYLPPGSPGDYKMYLVCGYVRVCMRALVCHADISKTTTATDFL